MAFGSNRKGGLAFGKPQRKKSTFGRTEREDNGPEVIGELAGAEIGLSEYKGSTNVAIAWPAGFRARPTFLSYDKMEWLAEHAAELFKLLTEYKPAE